MAISAELTTIQLQMGPDGNNPVPPEEGAHLQRVRILLIDDDALLRRSFSRILADHEVVACASGQDALATLGADRTFDLILCDLQMPGMDGMSTFEAASQLDERLASRFLFLTGGACDERTDAFLSVHATRVLWKPMSPAAVRGAIAAILEEGQPRAGAT